MAYTRTTWVTNQTPLSADNMNNIEDGIEETKTVIGNVGYTNVSENTSSTSVSANSYATIATLSLPAGIYVITGHVKFASIPANRVIIGVGTSASPSDSTDGTISHYSNTALSSTMGLQTSAIITLSDTSTVYLSAYSGAAVTVNSGILRAVRIK